MSVDSGEPRQRTVAELLAANGGSQTGRRRRRRAAEDDGPTGGPAPAGPGTPRRPVPADRTGAPSAGGRTTDGVTPRGGDGPAAEHPSFPSRRPEPAEGPGGSNGHVREADATYVPNGNAPNGALRGPVTGGAPLDHRPRGYAPNGRPAPNGHAPGRAEPGPPPNGYANGFDRGARRPDDGYGPPQGVPGRPPGPRPTTGEGPYPDVPYDDGRYGADGPDEIPTSRLGAHRPPADDHDGGPPTQFGAPPLTDEDDTATHRTQARSSPSDAGPPTGAYDPYADDARGDGGWDADPYGAGDRTGVLAPERPDLDEYEDHGELENGAVEDDAPHRRSGRRRGADVAEPPAGLEDTGSAGAAGTGQAWAVVIAQWIGGAVAGAAIWVLFRFLWFSYPVAAILLAVGLTLCLVLGVRALLRNDDLKTTLFAVLVGLLLTVSPAILVLLDR